MATLVQPGMKDIADEGATNRLEALDCLRGLCAIAVAMYHYHMWSGAVVPPFVAGLLAVAGTYGVSVFFILSGYSLAHAYQRKFQAGISAAQFEHYLKRRVGRLMPMFVVAIILSAIGKYVTSGKTDGVYEFLSNVFLIFGFVQPSSSVVIGGWSIGIEVVFYIIFPLMIIAERRKGLLLLCSILFTLWITSIVTGYGNLEDGWSWYVHPANHFIFFAVGVFARLSDRSWLDQNASLRVILLIAFVVGVSLCVSGGLTEFEAVTGLTRIVLIILACVLVYLAAGYQPHGMIRSVSGVMGGLSYPFYLFHPLGYFAFSAVGGAEEHGLKWLPLVFVAALAGAIFADRFVDGPVQKRLKVAGW